MPTDATRATATDLSNRQAIPIEGVLAEVDRELEGGAS